MRMKAILAIIFLLCASAPLSAQIVTCQQLINEAAAWNGKTVSITGEVVGDILRTSGFEWLNVNDGTNALGVWADIEAVEGMEIVPGNYGIIGTSLEVEGIFNRTCSLHSGETDIHLVNVKIVGGHIEVTHPVNQNRIIYAAILSVLGAVLTWAVASRRKSYGRIKTQ